MSVLGGQHNSYLLTLSLFEVPSTCSPFISSQEGGLEIHFMFLEWMQGGKRISGLIDIIGIVTGFSFVLFCFLDYNLGQGLDNLLLESDDKDAISKYAYKWIHLHKELGEGKPKQK